MFLLILQLLPFAIASRSSSADFSVSTDPIPIFSCTGPRFLCFEAVGSHFKEQILEIVTELPSFNQTLLPWFYDHFIEYLAFVETASLRYPFYFEELEALAVGAGVPFHVLFLLNIDAEVHALVKSRADPSCTDIHVNLPNRHLLGHNEDGNALFRKNSYFLNMTLTGDLPERFFAYSYAGMLPGIAFGWNEWMTLSGNALYPLECYVGGAPKTFVYRDSLTARSYSDAYSKIVDTFSVRAFGQTIHVGSLKDLTVRYAIENSPFQGAAMKIVGNYSHMNNYRIMANVPFWEEPSSVHRLRRTFEMPAPKTLQDIESILGDTEDPVYPLYRNGTIATLASCIFDYDSKLALIYTGNPKLTPPVMKLDLIL